MSRELFPGEVRCSVCGGSGETERWVQCDNCDGFGTVPETEGHR